MDKSLSILNAIEIQAKTSLLGSGKLFHELSQEWSAYNVAVFKESLDVKLLIRES